MNTTLTNTAHLYHAAIDWLESTDPGLTRLRNAIRVFLLVGSVLGLELVYSHTIGINQVAPMVLGASLAMVSTTTLTNPKTTTKIMTIGMMPLATATGLIAGGMLAGYPLFGLIGFVAITFLAVWIQHFGSRYFAHGFLAWSAYFYALLLQLASNLIPLLILSSVVAGGWVIVIALTMMRARPRLDVERTLKAFQARVRNVADAGLCVLRGDEERPESKLFLELRRLNQAALLIDARLGTDGAVPAGLDPRDIRGQLVDAELTANALVDAILELNDRREQLADDDLPPVRQALDQLARPWSGSPTVRPEVNGAHDLMRVVDLAQRLHRQVSELDQLPARLETASGSGNGRERRQFKPVVQLAAGRLPRSTPMAKKAAKEQSRHWIKPLARLDLVTRQAIQVGIAAGLALAAGYAISSTRYYWSLLAAYVAFTHAGTSDEAAGRAVGRAVGTLIGLGGAVVVVMATADHSHVAVLAILIGMALAFYVQPISYGVRVFFITLVVAELFDTIHIYSLELMVLRTELTAVGAAIGLVISLAVLPTNSADTNHVARRELLGSIATLLNGAAERLTGSGGQQDELAGARQVESNLQQMTQIMRPISRMLIFSENHDFVRQQLAWYTAAAMHAQGIAEAVSEHSVPRGHQLAQACRQLASVAQELANECSLHSDDRIEGQLEKIRATLASTPDVNGEAFDHARRLAGTLGRLARSGKTQGHIPNFGHNFSAAVHRQTGD